MDDDTPELAWDSIQTRLDNATLEQLKELAHGGIGEP